MGKGDTHVQRLWLRVAQAAGLDAQGMMVDIYRRRR